MRETDCPLSNREASLQLLYDKGDPILAQYEHTLLLRTDEHGEAHFNLPDPAPEHFEAWVGIGSEEHWWCACRMLGATKDVVQKGVVGPQPRSLKPSSRTANPGEILFVARPWTLFDRIVAPLVRE